MTNRTYGLFRSRSSTSTKRNCCLKPKMNINSRRANTGQDHLRQLRIHSNQYEQFTPEKMCDIMHFLFQQASRDKKSVSVTAGMFIIYDSSNLIFDRLIKTKISHQFNSPHRSVSSALATPPPKPKRLHSVSDDLYPTYGMDIPNTCLPNNLDHILLGELPPFVDDDKYFGRRMFIKPDRFDYERRKVPSGIRDLNSFVKQLVKQQFCRIAHGESKSECAKLRAFKENTDYIVFRKWSRILSKLPSKWKINKNDRKRAFKYGIREINRQSKDLETAGAGRKVIAFRKFLMKKYGNEDLSARKGQEFIFTIDELARSPSTCVTPKDNKCTS